MVQLGAGFADLILILAGTHEVDEVFTSQLSQSAKAFIGATITGAVLVVDKITVYNISAGIGIHRRVPLCW